ncbi:hypothetical protein ACFY30_10835 [Streptomyces sp. NPDC000345]|uniref:hypothetical protein n=1 Tax=Streptomyces sp. NPDC000345 TaxID=3364537 RepID=UPI003690862E
MSIRPGDDQVGADPTRRTLLGSAHVHGSVVRTGRAEARATAGEPSRALAARGPGTPPPGPAGLRGAKARSGSS